MTPTEIHASTPTASEALTLWRAHQSGSDPAARNKLIFLLSPMVHHVISIKRREIPAHLNPDELTSHGLTALIRSIDQYEPTADMTLEQHAWVNIRSAISDALHVEQYAHV